MRADEGSGGWEVEGGRGVEKSNCPEPLPGRPEVTVGGMVAMAAAGRLAGRSEDGGNRLVGESADRREDGATAGR